MFSLATCQLSKKTTAEWAKRDVIEMKT